MLDRAGWHDLVESQSTILSLGRLFGGEVFVGFDLILEVMLLDASGITRCFGGCLGILANRLLQVVWHSVASPTTEVVVLYL